MARCPVAVEPQAQPSVVKLQFHPVEQVRKGAAGNDTVVLQDLPVSVLINNQVQPVLPDPVMLQHEEGPDGLFVDIPVDGGPGLSRTECRTGGQHSKRGVVHLVVDRGDVSADAVLKIAGDKIPVLQAQLNSAVSYLHVGDIGPVGGGGLYRVGRDNFQKNIVGDFGVVVERTDKLRVEELKIEAQIKLCGYLPLDIGVGKPREDGPEGVLIQTGDSRVERVGTAAAAVFGEAQLRDFTRDRKSTRLNSSHVAISYAVFCLKKKRQHYVL